MNVRDCYPNQDPKVIFLYEIIGSYFTDVVFNHIYINARMKLTANSSSLVDEYVRRLQLYVIGLKNDAKCYDNTLKELHKYYVTVINSPVDINKFINIIIDTCIPPNFIHQLTPQNRTEIVSNIICDLVSNLVVFTSSPEIIKKITIDHKQNAPEVVKVLQDFSIQTLINKKLQIINKFLKESGQVSSTDTSIEIINELKQVIRKLVSEKNDLNENITKLEKQVSEFSDREVKLRKLIELMQIRQKELQTSFEEMQSRKHKKLRKHSSQMPTVVVPKVVEFKDISNEPIELDGNNADTEDTDKEIIEERKDNVNSISNLMVPKDIKPPRSLSVESMSQEFDEKIELVSSMPTQKISTFKPVVLSETEQEESDKSNESDKSDDDTE